jgi:hypothetical protein
MSRYKHIILLVVTFSALVDGFAQQKSIEGPWQFHSIYQAGLLKGQAGAALQLQTINGIQYKSWFAGIGAGIDYYRFRGIPLFFDARKAFGGSKNSFFVYADIGINFNWITNKQKLAYGMSQYKDISRGLYTDAGLGYKIRAGEKHSFLISGGYSFKSLLATSIDYSSVAFDGIPAVIGHSQISP